MGNIEVIGPAAVKKDAPIGRSIITRKIIMRNKSLTSFLRHIRWRVVVRRFAIALLGLFIAMLGLWVSLVLFILLFMGPETGRLPFNELPLIDDLPVAHSSSECVYWHFDSARGNHVCAFGRLEEKQTLPDLLPFLADVADWQSYLGADDLHGRIPIALLESFGNKTPFGPKDRVWITSVKGQKHPPRRYEVHAAESTESRTFYIEYGYSH